ncbi:response regulator [Deltaproteobacteria bacterium Smac51]|nr:response regulator [Deltaproteobacteria bacterium Smac51]
MRILIAEDQQITRLVLNTHLTGWGHQVIEASDGQEALDLISAENAEIDMLITDWGMPRLDGLELAQRVRELSADSKYIYIILLTNHTEPEDRIQGFAKGGVDDYIVKPFEVAELKQRIGVGNRLIMAERNLRLYSQSLERVVRRQTEAIRQTQGEIISRLFSALESRDQETGDHVRRIGFISARLGYYLGWEEREIDDIQAAAPLHDVGKIGILDSILRKPGPLTPDEFKIIQTHTVIGAHILADSQNPVIRMAETIALRHHENWDGTGYPDGLAGDEIPVEARVVAVADVYDALMTDRIYRRGLTEEKVLEIIRQERGKKFDPTIVDLFLRNIDEIRQGYQAMEREQSFDNLPYSISANLQVK